MKTLIAILTLLATPALAHVGHLGEVAGHGHWIAAGALGAAALAVWLRSKGDGKGGDAEAEERADEEPESSPT